MLLGVRLSKRLVLVASLLNLPPAIASISARRLWHMPFVAISLNIAFVLWDWG
jgi:ABC-type Mn2+/Zn2+ transport system permease subunit